MATDATTTSFAQEVLESDGKVLVDFWAEWCGPCHAVAPVLDRIAEERDLKLEKVKIDQEQELGQSHGVALDPMMTLCKKVQPQSAAVGAQPKGMLERALGLDAESNGA